MVILNSSWEEETAFYRRRQVLSKGRIGRKTEKETGSCQNVTKFPYLFQPLSKPSSSLEIFQVGKVDGNLASETEIQETLNVGRNGVLVLICWMKISTRPHRSLHATDFMSMRSVRLCVCTDVVYMYLISPDNPCSDKGRWGKQEE